MTLQMSVRVRNARADAAESTCGASPRLRLYTGAPPADCATAPTGTLIADMQLPADWLSNASAGVKSLLGTWQDLLADAAGVVGYYRIWDNALANCDFQGTVTLPGGGGDMTLINTNVAINQPITISTWSITEGNA